ncbi:MAG TPA: glycosyltransferase family 39 protein, partial [Candidatus Limnocylindrales bacterium]
MNAALGTVVRHPATWVAGLLLLGLLALAGQYGFHRDELYFIIAGRHPALGYPDQPPLTPLLTAGSAALLGTSPLAIRILPALAITACTLLAARMTHDLGGGRRAQVIAAISLGASGYLAAGHLASTATYDLLAWSVILALTIRLLVGADPRLWLVVGLVAGIGLENKFIPLFLGAGLIGGFVLARRWDVVRSPWAWTGLAIALVIWAPNLWWQAANGFPQLEMAAQIGGADNRSKFLLELTLLAGPVLFVVAIAGGWWLLHDRAARPWRAIGVAVLLVLLLLFASGGKSYYAAGLFGLLMAAGAIRVDRWLPAGRVTLRLSLFSGAAVVSGAIVVVLVLPVLPAATLAASPITELYKESAEQI